MGIYLNPGSEGFRTSLNSKIYVDKSAIIKYINPVLDTRQKYLCVSRPRRFGKTMTADMLSCYYDRTVDCTPLFNNLKITSVISNEDFSKHANQYDVIHITMTKFIKRDSDNIKTSLSNLTEEILWDMQDEYPDVKFRKPNDLSRILSDIFAKTRRKFVIIIDEWDSIFRIFPKDEASHIKYLDFLRDWLKDNNNVILVYMTGILPIKKYGEHSALNMFTEYSMEDPKQFGEFSGFTADEVRLLCQQYNVNYEKCKNWYNGYILSSTFGNDTKGDTISQTYEIYNPLSIIEVINSGKFQNYWNKTEGYEALKKYILINYYGIKDIIIKLMAGERQQITTATFKNDMSSFNSADDILTLLIHLGYLAYYSSTQEVFIPNNEIRDEFVTSIRNEDNWSIITNAILSSEATLQATWNKEEETVAKALENAHFETSILQYNDENALSYVISLAYYTSRSRYTIVRELPTGKGFADLVFIPLPHCPDAPAMIIELKWNKNADTAIKQIIANNYCKALGNYHGKLLLVAINYKKNTVSQHEVKHHQCIIKEIIL